jgi:hypothetical protein
LSASTSTLPIIPMRTIRTSPKAPPRKKGAKRDGLRHVEQSIERPARY